MLDHLMVFTSLLYLILIARYYVKHGCGYILPSNIFLLATAMFLAIPQLYAYYVLDISYRDLDAAIFYICLWILFLPYLILRLKSNKINRYLRGRNVVFSDYNLSFSNFKAYYFVCCFVILVLIMILIFAKIGEGSIIRMLELLLILSVAFYSFRRKKLSAVSMIVFILILLYFIFYIVFIFKGNGRLSLMLMLFAGFNIYLISINGSKKLKLLSILLIPLMLLLLGSVRMQTDEHSIQDVLLYGAGLDSMIAPYTTFIDVYDYVERYSEFMYGETFLAAFLFWVPRSVWDNKPIGLGSELTMILGNNQLIEQGHSMAAGYWGELYLNGGIVLIVIAPIFITYLLLKLDKVCVKILLHPRIKNKMHKLVMLSILSSGLGTYVWVGSFTFFSRDVLKIILLIIIYIALVKIRLGSFSHVRK